MTEVRKVHPLKFKDPFPLPLATGGRLESWTYSPPPTHPSTVALAHESEPCTLPGKHSGAAPDGRGVGELPHLIWPCRVSSAVLSRRDTELTLQAGARVTCPWGPESRRAGPAPLICHEVARARERSPLPHPVPPVAIGNADPEVTRAKEPALPLTSCSTQESGPCTLFGQYSRAGPGSVGAGELWKQNGPSPHSYCIGWAS